MVSQRLALSPDSQKVMGSNPRPFFVQLALSPCVCVGCLLVVWLIGILKLSVGVNVRCGRLVVCVPLSHDNWLVTRPNLLASRDNWEKLSENPECRIRGVRSWMDCIYLHTILFMLSKHCTQRPFIYSKTENKTYNHYILRSKSSMQMIN